MHSRRSDHENDPFGAVPFAQDREGRQIAAALASLGVAPAPFSFFTLAFLRGPLSSRGVLAMAIAKEEVEKVALLARLALSDDEIAAMTLELGQIIGYVELLGQLDADSVEPMAHAIEQTNVLADDLLQPSLDRQRALANAPARDDECYLVPAVLGRPTP
jgi:aspartyl-tRNA(Asn)/glutamyl-tRNA(Gln) amidotransferase subunit C